MSRLLYLAHMARLIDASHALKRLIADHDLTQAEVAEAARVTPVTANRWVNGKQRADSETIYRAIKNLGQDPAEYGIELRKPMDDSGMDSAPAWFLDALAAMEARLEQAAEVRHQALLVAIRSR